MKRLEGIAKLTGAERYVDDLPLEGCLWGMTVRSPGPRGRIREIRFGDGVDWSEVVVVDHRDVPGPNVVTLIESDQPFLADGVVRHRDANAAHHTATHTLSKATNHAQARAPRQPPGHRHIATRTETNACDGAS